MKPKDFRKKLILNKNTIADLNNKQMKEIMGGETGQNTTCLTWKSFLVPSGCYSVYPDPCPLC